MKLPSTIVQFLLVIAAYGQNTSEDYLKRLPSGDGYSNQQGDTLIYPGKYLACTTDTFRTYAIVLKPGGSWVLINRQEKILFKLYTEFEPYPDYAEIQSDLFRFIIDSLIGFGNLKGDMVIQPRFKNINAFEGDYAIFCEGCKYGKYIDDVHGYEFFNGKWGTIDKKGNVIIPAIYDEQFKFQDGVAEVKLNKTQFKINTHGERVHEKMH